MAPTYDAFISYSHAADGKLALALQNALQRFAKPWYRLRALHLFRDQTSLSATPGLWPAIEAALTNSRYFLLLASPLAAQSRWVQQEVGWWLQHKSPQTMLIGLTDGQIKRREGATDFDWDATDALPLNLRGVFTENPLWVDFRWAKEQEQLSTKNPEFQNALAALAAPLRNLPKEDLIGEDVKQHRLAMLLARGAVVILGLLLIVALAASVVAWVKQTEANRQAEIALTRGLAAEAELQRTIGQNESAALLAGSAYRLNVSSGEAMWAPVEEALQSTVGTPYFGFTLRGEHGASLPHFARSLAISKDGLLATATNDPSVWLWDVGSGKTLHLLGQLQASPVNEVEPDHLVVAFSPDGSRLATGGKDGVVRLYETADLRTPWQGPKPEALLALLDLHDPVPVLAVAFSPDGTRLAAGTRNGRVRTWEMSDLQNFIDLVAPSNSGGNQVWSLAFKPDDSDVLASASTDGRVQLWDLKTDRKTTDLTDDADRQPIWSVAFNPMNTNEVVAGSSVENGAGTILQWDLSGDPHHPVQAFRGHDEVVSAVAFSPDGQLLASGGHDESVRLWDPDRPARAVAVLGGAEEWVRAVAFSPDLHWLASSGPNRTVRLWDLGDSVAGIAAPAILPAPSASNAGGQDWATALAFSPTGKSLAVTRHDGQILRWPIADPHNTVRQTLGDFNDAAATTNTCTEVNVPIFAIAVPNDTEVVAVNSHGDIFRWDATTPPQAHQDTLLTDFPVDPVRALVMSPDGALLIASTQDDQVLLWDLHAQSSPPVLLGRAKICSLAMSADGHTLIAAGDQGIYLSDLTHRDQPGPIELRIEKGNCGFGAENVRAVAVSRDGLRIAAAGDDRQIWWWQRSEAETLWICQQQLIGHEGPVKSLAFGGQDERFLVSGGADETLRLWYLPLPEVGAVLARGEEHVAAIIFDRSSQTLASTSADGAVRLSIVDDVKLGEIVCQRLEQNSPPEGDRFPVEAVSIAKACPEPS